MKYRKRPVVVEAFRWLEDETPQWFHDLKGTAVYVETGELVIPTLEGRMNAKPGDWIIRGVAGEVYPCKDAIFRATYEAVEESASAGGGA